MKIYDISKELFAEKIFPGDPVPESRAYFSIENGDICNLSVLTLGTHNGTHMDAPYHFLPAGKKVNEINLERCVGSCEVIGLEGNVDAGILAERMSERCRKLLIKGNVHLTVQAARYLTDRGIELLGVEANTVGDENNGAEVHLTLLGSEIVVVENLELKDVPEGAYFLVSVPLNAAGLDGSPCRPVLIGGISV